MKTAMKFITDSIGLFMSLFIISASITVFLIVKPVHEYVAEKGKTQVILQQMAEFSPYDNHPVSGSNVLTAMRRYSSTDYVAIYVRNGAGNTFIANPSGSTAGCYVIDYNTGKITSSRTVATVTAAQMSNESSPYYVAYQSKYQATLVIDKNKVVVGVYFDKK